jgi:hypothetical protein
MSSFMYKIKKKIIFKSFKPHLQAIFVFKSDHYNV